MNIWEKTCWESKYCNSDIRTGLRLKSDKGVDAEVKRACKDFCKWLRKKYCFPVRVPVYLKSSYRIKSKDGDTVCGTFFEPDNACVEPYIRIATGDYNELVEKWGKDNALASILIVIAHELTHYFQWINDVDLTENGYDRQAINYSKSILYEYAQTTEHP